jgi:hypothetical protein
VAVLEYARAHAIDLIAMEMHERSVADSVLGGAAVPLLLHRSHHRNRPDVCLSIPEILAGQVHDERSSIDDVLTFA